MTDTDPSITDIHYSRHAEIFLGEKTHFQNWNYRDILAKQLQEAFTALRHVDVNAAILWDQSDKLLHRPDIPKRWWEGERLQ